MSKSLIEIHKCDICKKETKITTINYPVLFLTEQTEGRSCKPYIQQTKIDVCDECLSKVLKLTTTGAQGFNDYIIKEQNNETDEN